MDSLVELIKKSIDIPTYILVYIDSKLDVNDAPRNAVCCPFHKEETPSFTYSPTKKLWRCWGKCKIGGDVIALHQRNYNLRTRDDAIKSLASILNINEKTNLTFELPKVKLDEEHINYVAAYNNAKMVALTIDDWLELDYIMSQYRPENELQEELEAFANLRKKRC
jgi:DNA primase